MNTIEHIESIG